MAKRLTERQRLALKLDSLNDSEVVEVLDYISIMETMRRASVLPGVWEDEMISMLAAAHVDRRDEQEFGREACRRRVESPAFALSVSVWKLMRGSEPYYG